MSDDETGMPMPIIRIRYDENEFNKNIKWEKERINGLVNKLNNTIDLNEELTIGNELNIYVRRLLEQLNSKKRAKQLMQEQEEAQKKEVRVIFRTKPPIAVKCVLGEKISDIIERYRSQSGDTDPNKIFLYNCHVLQPTWSAYDSGFTDYTMILVIEKKN